MTVYKRIKGTQVKFDALEVCCERLLVAVKIQYAQWWSAALDLRDLTRHHVTLEASSSSLLHNLAGQRSDSHAQEEMAQFEGS